MIPLLGSPCGCHAAAPCGCAGELSGIADWFQAAAPTDSAPLFKCDDQGAVAAYLARVSTGATAQGFAWGVIVGALGVTAVVVFARQLGGQVREGKSLAREVAPDVIRAYIGKGGRR